MTAVPASARILASSSMPRPMENIGARRRLPRPGRAALCYRLTIRTPRPSFNVSFSPTAPAVAKGGADSITATANRIDEFDGPIEIKIDNLPPGFRLRPRRSRPAKIAQNSALFAEPTATVPTGGPVEARCPCDDSRQGRGAEAAGALPKVVDPGNIVTTTDVIRRTVAPGGDAPRDGEGGTSQRLRGPCPWKCPACRTACAYSTWASTAFSSRRKRVHGPLLSTPSRGWN